MVFQAIFADKLVNEASRTPFFTFDYNPFGDDDATYRVEIYPPLLSFYVQIATNILTQVVLSCALGIIMYYGIVVPQQQQQLKRNQLKQKQQDKTSFTSTTTTTTTTIQGMILGYAIIIPLAIYLPFIWLDCWDIRSKSQRLSWVCIPLIVTMNCMESMYGFLPKHACISLKHYLLYVACIVKPKLIKLNKKVKETEGSRNKTIQSTTATTSSDNGTVNGDRSSSNGADGVQHEHEYDYYYHHADATSSTTWTAFGRYCYWFFVTNVAFLLFHPSNFEPFTFATSTSSSRSSNEIFVAVPFLGSNNIGTLYNTFVQASLCNMLLVFSMSGVGTVIMLLTQKQYQYEITHSPMILSTSISNFWNDRWNTLIHQSLKQGCYKPTRFVFTKNNKYLAYVTTFVVSGILHELVWRILFFQTSQEHALELANECTTCYKAKYGKQLLFFGWNGILLVLVEHTLVGKTMLKMGRQYLPRLLFSHIIVLLSLPVGHYFTGDITLGNAYHHAQHGFFMLKVY